MSAQLDRSLRTVTSKFISLRALANKISETFVYIFSSEESCPISSGIIPISVIKDKTSILLISNMTFCKLLLAVAKSKLELSRIRERNST